ncbi:hypothetical protein [Streptomyces hirsutus]|uniref:hypothetical protein n=1 Tax=Streptomyces hirsutus TaxID=35620 RepID=UPI00331E4A2F
MATAIAHAATAAPLAALLPARRRKPWTVGPAQYCIRASAPMSRITDGRRTLIVVEQAGLLEVFVDAPDEFAVTPVAVVDATGPDPVAALAARLLRTVLPQLDTTAGHRTYWEKGHKAAHAGQAADLLELGYALIDHGAHPQTTHRIDGPALTWTTTAGAHCDVMAYGAHGTYTLTYEGPLCGLYGLLPLLLPPYDGPALPDVTSGFTYHLTKRFPQLRTAQDCELDFGTQGEPYGFITTPSEDTPTDRVNDTTPVVAQIGHLGTDLLLTAAPHLI